MNIKILLIALGVVSVSSCSTAYRNGQTPDDVYYSPARAIEETEEDNKEEDSRVYNDAQHDRQVRMSRYDRRWRDFDDDFNWRYDPYRYGYSYGYYYNPYYFPFPVYLGGITVRNPKNSTPRMTNLGSYQYSNIQVVNPKTGVVESTNRGRQYNRNNSGGIIRQIIAPSGNRSSGNDTRSYSPSSSGRSGSGSPVSRPTR